MERITPAEARARFEEALARFLEADNFGSGQCNKRSTVQARQRRNERLPPDPGGKGSRVKLIIGNRNYSSWSLRGWLACKQSGLAFEELTVNISGEDWEEAKRAMGEVQPSRGKVPILWDGETVVWDSLAILEYLGDKVGRDRFWPKDDVARGMARSMVAEMHSGYLPLRRALPMNVRARHEGVDLPDPVKADVVRILQLWAEARARFGHGGPFLFGTFGAADVFYAPVVSRFVSYGIAVPGFAQAYMQAVWEHDWMQTWIKGAEDEQWVIEQWDTVPAA